MLDVKEEPEELVMVQQSLLASAVALKLQSSPSRSRWVLDSASCWPPLEDGRCCPIHLERM